MADKLQRNTSAIEWDASGLPHSAPNFTRDSEKAAAIQRCKDNAAKNVARITLPIAQQELKGTCLTLRRSFGKLSCDAALDTWACLVEACIVLLADSSLLGYNGFKDELHFELARNMTLSKNRTLVLTKFHEACGRLEMFNKACGRQSTINPSDDPVQLAVRKLIRPLLYLVQRYSILYKDDESFRELFVDAMKSAIYQNAGEGSSSCAISSVDVQKANYRKRARDQWVASSSQDAFASASVASVDYAKKVARDEKQSSRVCEFCHSTGANCFPDCVTNRNRPKDTRPLHFYCMECIHRLIDDDKPSCISCDTYVDTRDKGAFDTYCVVEEEQKPFQQVKRVTRQEDVPEKRLGPRCAVCNLTYSKEGDELMICECESCTKYVSNGLDSMYAKAVHLLCAREYCQSPRAWTKVPSGRFFYSYIIGHSHVYHAPSKLERGDAVFHHVDGYKRGDECVDDDDNADADDAPPPDAEPAHAAPQLHTHPSVESVDDAADADYVPDHATSSAPIAPRRRTRSCLPADEPTVFFASNDYFFTKFSHDMVPQALEAYIATRGTSDVKNITNKIVASIKEGLDLYLVASMNTDALQTHQARRDPVIFGSNAFSIVLESTIMDEANCKCTSPALIHTRDHLRHKEPLKDAIRSFSIIRGYMTVYGEGLESIKEGTKIADCVWAGRDYVRE